MKYVIILPLLTLALGGMVAQAAPSKGARNANHAAARTVTAPAALENCTLHLVWKEVPNEDTHLTFGKGTEQNLSGSAWVWGDDPGYTRIGTSYTKIGQNKANLSLTSTYFGKIGESIDLTFTSESEGTFTAENCEQTPLKFYITR